MSGPRSLVTTLLIVIVVAPCLKGSQVSAAGMQADSTWVSKFGLDASTLPAAAFAQMEAINVRNLDIKDVFRGIGTQYGLNLVVDNSIVQAITIRLSALPVIDVIEFLCEEYGLRLIQSGRILRILPPVRPPPVIPPTPVIAASVDSTGNLHADLKGEDLEDVIRNLAQESGRNILIRQGVKGTLRGLIRNIPFDSGLAMLLANNGFTVRERDQVLIVDRVGSVGEGATATGGLWVNVSGGLVSLDVVGAPISAVFQEIAFQSQMNMITYTVPEGNITAKFQDLPMDVALNLLFKNTNITFRRDGNVYFIGSKTTSGIATSRLIRLKHIRSDGVIQLLPESLKRAANIQVVKELNALMVIGTNDIIFETEQFIAQIDYPTPQILIEALVVDFEDSDSYELGVMLGTSRAPDSTFAGTFINFGGTAGDAGLTVQANGDAINRVLGSTEIFGTRIAVLPNDFYARIRAMSRDGLINVRSRPQISTLNGHSATITIGTTQYFILKSTTPLQSPNQIVTQESERFEKIEANVSLTITPWVSASGEVTAEILPEFSTPVGGLNPNVPPTINTRVLESTVRLKDGETIILGGLIQDSEVTINNKVPVLGSIPWIGKLFRSTSREMRKSELVIFITPHVFYGDDMESEKWLRLQEQLNK